jgi:gliding motility-associated-like protein
MIRFKKLLVLVITLLSASLFSQNLLTNGDFESGGSGTGFTVPGYNLYSGFGGITPGNYTISNNPTPLNSFFITNIQDHSPGAGNNMMVVDGHTNTNASFWSAGNNAAGLCGLTIGSTYTFSYWIRTISSTTVDATTQPNISVNFSNATGIINFGNPTVALPTIGWQQVIYSFVPTATCVNINLINTNTSPGGNDFALDDLEVSLQLCPLTILSITSPSAVCSPATVDITAPAITLGSIGGGVLTYWQDNLATIPLSAPAAITMSGTYYIRSVSGPTCSDIKPVLVTIKPTIVPTFTPVVPICSGDTLNPLPVLSNNGVIGSWAPALNNTTTTIYTFTPSASLNPNLVINGDFTQGNIGFSTNYTYAATSNGTVQGVYGIVTNANAWFSSLSSCTDHTGGGNFMVADASTTNGGNDSVWCQTIPVQAGENFIFSFYAQSVSSGSPANFEVTINGTSIGTNSLDFSTCNWIQSSFPWNSGASTSANICIYNRNTTLFGNDFGIDDISFVPTSIQCATTTPMTITVNTPVTPTFTAIAPICLGGSFTLPTTSTNGIVGTWSPAPDFTTTTIYTFTPTAGQCATTATMTVTVNTAVTPTFTAIAPICSGGSFTLPTTSTNGIGGTWSPAPNFTTTTIYTFAPTAGQCATTATMTVTVNNAVTPTFTAIAPICSGGSFTLATTSTNGIVGTWSPAPDFTTTTIYTFAPTTGQCATAATMTVTVNTPVIPTFTAISPICSGGSFTLPTTSTNGVVGTWSPAPDFTITTIYTFTPTAGQCATTATMTITVNTPVIPTFTAIAPICSGGSFTLPTTSTNGIVGTWSPAINNTTATTYTFTPSTTTNPNLVTNGDFSQGNTGFSSDYGFTTTSIGAQGYYGIAINSGTWFGGSSCADHTGGGNQMIVDASTANGGNDRVWCQTITVQAGKDYIFSFYAQTIFAGYSSANFEVTINGISVGTSFLGNTLCDWTQNVFPWNSGTNTSALICIYDRNTEPYGNDFSIDDIIFVESIQCATTATMTVTVNTPVTPTFTAIAPICSGGSFTLPTTSTNGIVGTWSPAPDFTTTTIYTFTPTAGQCATTATMTVTVNTPVIPTFTAIAPICLGGSFTLPTTSTNGIVGTWSPAPDFTTTTIYTFAPTAGQCATTATMTVTVNTPVTPTFTAIAPICSGGSFTLPATSTNGIGGTWSPAPNFTTTTIYTFTPTAGQCATTATIPVTVNTSVIPTFTAIAPICSGGSFTLPATSTNGIVGTWSPAPDFTTTTIYTFAPTAGQCANAATMTVTVNTPVTPTFTAIAPICLGGTFILPTTSTNGIVGTWSPAPDFTTTTIYTFTPTAGQCATTATMTVTVNTPILPIFDPVVPICEGDTINNLPTTSLEGIVGSWSPTLDNTTTTTYTFTPNPGQCATTANLEIVVNYKEEPVFDLIDQICLGKPVPILPTISLNGISGSWNPSIVDNTTSGTYEFIPDSGQCANTYTHDIIVYTPTLTAVSYEVGEPFSGNNTIVVNASAEGNYLYQLDNGAFQEENIFYNVELGEHTVTVIDINNCADPIVGEVLLIDYPKFFTPNADGYNDTWNLFGFNNQPSAKIFIFDRYGKLLKQISSSTAGWDGTYNGKELPATDYWFTVDYKYFNADKQFKAHFALKR